MTRRRRSRRLFIFSETPAAAVATDFLLSRVLAFKKNFRHNKYWTNKGVYWGWTVITFGKKGALWGAFCTCATCPGTSDVFYLMDGDGRFYCC